MVEMLESDINNKRDKLKEINQQLNNSMFWYDEIDQESGLNIDQIIVDP